MAKISPVSIKYMIHLNFLAEGALEKPDVIGAIFGQTEGLLGADLEMRELQKEGKIGRIEVHLEKEGSKTKGKILVPTALDQSETALVGAAIETIDRIGPCDAHIEVEKIEDVRGNKREYILERAKKLMEELTGAADSREISRAVVESVKASKINEYGEEKVPCGDISGKELIVVEGRADVLNLLRAGVENVIAMNGTKLPKSVAELTKGKETTLFVDGDRGGKLIIQNVVENANVDYIAMAPDGKEVEELTKKEILMSLRKKMPVEEYLKKEPAQEEGGKTPSSKDVEKIKEFTSKTKIGNKAFLLDSSFNILEEHPIKGLSAAIRKIKPYAVVIGGTATRAVLKSAKEEGCKLIAAKNFASSDNDLKLVSI